MASMNKKV